MKLRWQPESYDSKAQKNKLSLLGFHFHEQVDESNKLVDLLLKLKCQFLTLGNKHGKYPQLSNSWLGIFKGSLTDVAKMHPKKVKHVNIYSTPLLSSQKLFSRSARISPFSTKSESLCFSVLLWMLLRKVHQDRLLFLFFPSITCLNTALFWNIARSQFEGTFCGKMAMGNSQVAFNQIS